MRNYTQRYQYDEVGNFVKTRHIVGVGTGWTRHYTTQPDSNRLDQTWYGNNTPKAVTYLHDAHGNMLNLNRLAAPRDPTEEWGLSMRWDWRDMLMVFDINDSQRALYHYDIDRQRTRKHIERATGVETRIYLNGYELYQRKSAQGRVVEEIESHHLFEGEQRILLVNDVILSSTGLTRAQPGRLTLRQHTLFRYQYGNHLGSACLELDHSGDIISYEEYHPFGSSAYRLMHAQSEAPPKRYRYTGMERDEESGLNYLGARYCAPELSRWCSADPQRLSGGLNSFAFVDSNPVLFADRNGRIGTLALGLIGGAVGFVGGVAYGLYKGESLKTSLEYGVTGGVLLGVAGLTLGASIATTGSVAAGVTAWGTKAIVGAGLSSSRQTLEIRANKRTEISPLEMAKSAVLATAPVPAKLAVPVAGAAGSYMMAKGAQEIGNQSGNEYEKALGMFDATVGMFSYVAPFMSTGPGTGPMIPALANGAVRTSAVSSEASVASTPAGPIVSMAMSGRYDDSPPPSKTKQEHHDDLDQELEGGGVKIKKIPPKGSKLHDHHLLPQEFKEIFWNRFKLNIENFKIWLESDIHLNHFHGSGGWNETWDEWLLDPKNAQATQADALNKLKAMELQWDAQSHSLGKSAPKSPARPNGREEAAACREGGAVVLLG